MNENWRRAPNAALRDALRSCLARQLSRGLSALVSRIVAIEIGSPPTSAGKTMLGADITRHQVNHIQDSIPFLRYQNQVALIRRSAPS